MSLLYPRTLSLEGSFWKASKGWLKEPPLSPWGRGSRRSATRTQPGSGNRHLATARLLILH